MNTKVSPHQFHIPVMGTSFTIDTPLKVAKYGISSVIALADDLLIERIREFYCRQENEPYEAISDREEDHRARRITAYLNLVNRLVKRQIEKLRAGIFEKHSEITQYFDMLPPSSPLKKAYQLMCATEEPVEKEALQEQLRAQIIPGSIDVNIMTKVDRDQYKRGQKLAPEFSDALSNLRGYANSTLSSSVVFSAGMNPRLYRYISTFKDFWLDETGTFKKKVTLKVSDYRSAYIQGMFLAKQGVWISEYRVESGLNCGGHAFATPGFLMGPILEEFKNRKNELIEKLHQLYLDALTKRDMPIPQTPCDVRVTVQGGVGTAEENHFLLEHYGVDSVGWGTPFLLVPDATTLDDEHIQKLRSATQDDVFLSELSPLGVPFWALRNSASEEHRRDNISQGVPGSTCPQGFLKLTSTEFSKLPICLASRAYQSRKLKQIQNGNYSPPERQALENSVTSKTCLCVDLAGAANIKYKLAENSTPAVCCGPSIIDFSKRATLKEMVDHIYGRISLVTNPTRPHMFIREMKLYLDHLRDRREKFLSGSAVLTEKYFNEYKTNMLNSIEYYRQLAENFIDEKRKSFVEEINQIKMALEGMQLGLMETSCC